MTETKPKRRWFRFSLRSLLVLVTAFCVWLGWEVNATRRQKEAVQAIVKAGGTIGYDFQMIPNAIYGKLLRGSRPPYESGLFSTKYHLDQNAIPSPPAWLRDNIGNDFFRNVASVSFLRASAVKPMTDIEHIAKLPALKQFYLLGGYPNREEYPKIQSVDFTALADLKCLEALTIFNFRLDGPVLARFRSLGRLTHVSLCNTGFDDAAMEQVGRMINLEYLWLDHTHVTDAGIAHVQRLTNLKVLYLNEADITDAGLKQLAGLNQLTDLWLRQTQVTHNGIRDLQKSLPNCTITGP